MIGYVLLIALAIGLSVGVFYYLKLYLPSENPKCSQEITLSIDKLNCTISGSSYDVYVELTNRGLFTVDSAYIKIGDEDRIVKDLLNNPEERLTSSCNSFEIGLKPGDSFCENYVYNPTEVTSTKEVSIEPLVYIDNTAVLCPEGITTKKVKCT